MQKPKISSSCSSWFPDQFFHLDNGIGQRAFGAAAGADDTAFQLGVGSNLCPRPEDRILDHRARADLAARPDAGAAAHFRARIDRGIGRDALRPTGSRT